MRKFFVITIAIICIGAAHNSLKAQCIFGSGENASNHSKFPGTAPAPWAIDGQLTDWNTIAGYNGNYSVEMNIEAHPLDIDQPEPKNNIRIQYYQGDIKNYFFYFKKQAVSNQPQYFFYFLDINLDSYMNDGEPVIGGRFNGSTIIEYALYVFKTDPTAPGYVAGKGNAMLDANGITDGFSLSGSVEKLFNSHHIPASASLGAGEIFSAAITENGLGVEMAVPLQYLKNWNIAGAAPLNNHQILQYKVVLQSGTGTNPNRPYNKLLVVDNIGTCCKKLLYTQMPTYEILSSVATRISATSYRVRYTFKNTAISSIRIGVGVLNLDNILPASSSDATFGITVNGTSFQQSLVTPNQYYAFGGGATIDLAPQATGTIDVVIDLPAPPTIVSQVGISLIMDNSVFLLPYYCSSPNSSGGGNPIPPIIFEVVPDTRNLRNPLAEESASFKVYPNPSKGNITVDVPTSGHVTIEDASGKIIEKRTVAGNTKMNFNGLKPGFYILRYRSGTGKEFIAKLIVQ